MMDDVLISNLSPNILRSCLRTLVSQGAAIQQPFVQHVQGIFTKSPPDLPPPETMFDIDDKLSLACRQYLKTTRCIFSCKLAKQSLPYLTHLVTSIFLSEIQWSEGSELHIAFQTFGGDVIQAVQALKELTPEPTDELKDDLISLVDALDKCRAYCGANSLMYPFDRCERQVRDVYTMLFAATLPKLDNPMATLEISVGKLGSVETTHLGTHLVPRLFNGFWQLSSPAWVSGTARSQERALMRLLESGLVAADMADHYGDAELVYGDFRAKLTPEVRSQVYAATKWCVFRPVGHEVTYEWVLEAVKERTRRLSGRVELMQFHWYDYHCKDYLKILEALVTICKTHPELVSTIGLCNFDSEHVEEACEYLLEKTGEVHLVSNQVQFSLFDSRPLHRMTAVCSKYKLKLLTYGSFCGGLLSAKWLGQAIPDIYSESQGLTPSQRKYLDMITVWGSWTEFQSLLVCLLGISKQHNVSLTNVATRWVLQQPSVGAIIVGTRLGVTAREAENLDVFTFSLNDDEIQAINSIALGVNGEKSLAMFKSLGDCGDEYRTIN